MVRKEQKSLRQLAKELGVSASYLSQVSHGKRPPSEKLSEDLHKVLSISGTTVKQSTKQHGCSWRGRMGVEPTRDSLMPPNGFEVREAHRDSTAP